MSKMVKKVNERKHVRYNIKFEYLDGNFSIASVDEAKYDKTNYRSMINFYHYVLKHYKLKNVDKIKFQGINQNNQIHVFFTKEIANENDLDENKYTSMDNVEILKEMVNLVSALNTRETKDLNQLKATLDKKQDVILHQIETFDLAEFDEDVSMEEKIRLFDQLKEVRKERRELKNDISTLSEVKRKVDLDKLGDDLNKIVQCHLNKNKKFKFLSDELVEELHIMKEIGYKNSKQRIAYMKQLQSKYDKVVNDELHRKLICYNKAC